MATKEEIQELFNKFNDKMDKNHNENIERFRSLSEEIRNINNSMKQFMINMKNTDKRLDDRDVMSDNELKFFREESNQIKSDKIRENEEGFGFMNNVLDEKLNKNTGEFFTAMGEDFSEILDDEEDSLKESYISFDKDNDDNDSYDSYDSDFDDREVYDDNFTDMDDLEVFDIICESDDSFSFETTYLYDNCFVNDDSLNWNEQEVSDVTDEISVSLYQEGNSLKKHTVCNAASMTAMQCRKCGDMSAKILLAKDLMANVVGNDEKLPRMLWDPGVAIVSNNGIVS